MQSTPVPEKAAPRHAPLALWRIALAFLNTLHMLFGTPEDVARAHTMTRQAHALLHSWLSTAEALMRRLLLIEAAACPAMATPHATVRRPQRERTRRLHVFEPDAPEQWRVSFRCFLSPQRQRAARAGAAAKDTTRSQRCFYSAWPLAERYEALIRVFNDPGAAARRLGRRLRAVPARLAEVLRAPPEARHRIDEFEALTEEARHPFTQSPNTS